jgi:hypothetical protein
MSVINEIVSNSKEIVNPLIKCEGVVFQTKFLKHLVH